MSGVPVCDHCGQPVGQLGMADARNKRLSDELAVRSRELGETLRRAEKAEEYGRAADRRFDIQRQAIQAVQKELSEARSSLAAVTDNRPST